jgi:hypothetical protein
MNAETSRLEASIEAMRLYFPEFSLSGLPLGTGPVAVWKGRLRPVVDAVPQEEILDDIHHGRPVMMRAGGIIEHRPDCAAEHCHHDWMVKVLASFPEYKLEVQYGGGQAHPRAYVRNPVVPFFKREKHHYKDGALCAYPPWLGVWRWDRHTVVEFMSHAAEWLIKWAVWEQAGVWLGAEMGHDPRLLLHEIQPEQECHCGSGKQYQFCDRQGDVAQAGLRLNHPGWQVGVARPMLVRQLSRIGVSGSAT